tara:strand:+ start:632 stop:826 length:195 start_codon:yes stop_codon:yes gene_type:complete
MVGSGRANQFGYRKRISLQKLELIMDRVEKQLKIHETPYILFLIGFIFDNYECTSRKFLVNPSK